MAFATKPSLAAAVFGFLVACRGASQPPLAGGAHGGAPAPTPAPTRVWLRLDSLLRLDLRKAWKAVPESPVQVERRADGSLLVPDNPDPVNLPDEVRWLPTPERGLGLLAQGAVDLHLDTPDGPVVGTAAPGTFLPVLTPGPRTTEIALFDHWTAVEGRIPGPVRVFVDSSALGLAAPEPPAAPAESADYFDWQLPLSPSPGGAPFTHTHCGPIHVLARDGVRLQVTQVRDGIRVTGWIDEAPPWRRGSFRCSPRVIEGPSPTRPRPVAASDIPRDYVRVRDDPSLADPLGPLTRRGGSLYWIEPGVEDDGLTCVEWHLAPTAPKKPGLDRFDRMGTLRRPPTKDGRSTAQGFEYVARQGPLPAQLSLDDDPECDGVFAIVGADADRISLLKGFYPFGVVAYHPDDREDWYLNRDACEAAARRMEGTAPGLGRVHPC